jgi:hypothetical protein
LHRDDLNAIRPRENAPRLAAAPTWQHLNFAAETTEAFRFIVANDDAVVLPHDDSAIRLFDNRASAVDPLAALIVHLLDATLIGHARTPVGPLTLLATAGRRLLSRLLPRGCLRRLLRLCCWRRLGRLLPLLPWLLRLRRGRLSGLLLRRRTRLRGLLRLSSRRRLGRLLRGRIGGLRRPLTGALVARRLRRLLRLLLTRRGVGRPLWRLSRSL